MDGNDNNIPSEDIEEEEDSGSYFLQPTSSPYDIAEKIKQANDDLYNENQNYEDKESKVKFKDNLIDYEPVFSYDDASSIESDENVDYSLMEHDTALLENQLQSALILNVSNSDIEEEEEEEIIEEIPVDESTPPREIEEENINFNVQLENFPKESKESKNNNNFQNTAVKRDIKPKFNIFIPGGISCKRHCIDDVDRFDFNSNIKKIELVEKPYKCPRLKLRKRNCCENNELKLHQKLPLYNGLKSEYGLNALQLESRQRRNETLKLKERERNRVIEERKRQKEQQNEEVFCAWLKDVSSRKIHQKKMNRQPSSLTSTTLIFPSKPFEGEKRPRTTSYRFNKSNIKKQRPHTSSSCVFIELPQSVLRNGINIGDLLVTKGSQAVTKKLHVLTVS
ncbi:hypothetical protein FQR65_LT08501 [Abscondita terminalis]|nr:hypothetical protein FQR65_LT08501 [Abscondita terminalis]